MGLFGDLFDVATDVAKVVIAPVEVVASVAKELTGEIASEVGEAAKSIKDTIRRGY